MVVDDELSLAEIATSYLEEAGYSVTCAENADHALHILNKNTFDMVFTDIVMPGSMNGYQLANWLLEKRPEITVLLTSGYTAASIEKNMSKQSSNLLITKPYQRNELLIAVREQLDK